MRPLYKTAIHQPKKRGRDGHAGLWFDKFCDRWPADETWTLSNKENDKKRNLKLDWINDVTESKVGAPSEIEEYALRLTRLVERRGGCIAVLTTESRFVTGLGHSHPVENGFAWHPTLGTPYLPGSSVKGLVCAWAKAEAEPGRAADARKRLFGSVGNVGSVCFMDAVPVAPVRLDADVMTPHYAGWSAGKREPPDDRTSPKPPGDWMSPTPIPFLTVAAGNSFLFTFIPGRVVSSEDLNMVEDWLRAALAWAGGGAKTAVGYGRFAPSDKETRSWTELVRTELLRQDALKGPAGRWRLEVEGKTEAEILDQVRIHLEKERLTDPAERRAFADAVLSVQPDWVERWRSGRKEDPLTSVGRLKLKERARLLDNAAAEAASDTDGREGNGSSSTGS